MILDKKNDTLFPLMDTLKSITYHLNIQFIPPSNSTIPTTNSASPSKPETNLLLSMNEIQYRNVMRTLWYFVDYVLLDETKVDYIPPQQSYQILIYSANIIFFPHSFENSLHLRPCQSKKIQCLGLNMRVGIGYVPICLSPFPRLTQLLIFYSILQLKESERRYNIREEPP